MLNNKLYKEWLSKAENDFHFAKINLEEEREFFDQICFHFQQAAEKYLKAYILAKNLKFRKLHELPTLLDICVRQDKSFEALREATEFLTEFYIETRYPTIWAGKITKDEAFEALKKIEELRKFILGKLK